MEKTAGRMIAAVLAAGLLMTGCGGSQESEDKPSMFVRVENKLLWNVYYHKDTKVMYIMAVSAGGGVAWEVLVNPDGTPMIWEEKAE